MFGFSSRKQPATNQDLLDELDKVKRQVRSLELEWESTYNKLRAIVARLNKRDERAAAEAEDASPLKDQPNGFPPAPLLNRPVRRLRGF